MNRLKIIISIDFETCCELDVKKVGSYKYSIHESCGVLCLALIIDVPYLGLRKRLLTINKMQFDRIKKYFNHPDFDFEIHAYNANFEYCIWHNVLVRKHGWPPIPEDKWFCSAAKAATYGLPRKMEKCALALGLEEQKDMSGHRLMMKLSSPTLKWRKTQTGPKWYQDKKELIKLYKYCLQDVFVERAISRRLDNLTEYERRIWLLDQKINRRGIPVDLTLARNCIKAFEIECESARIKTRKLTNNAVSSPSQVALLTKWINEHLELDEYINSLNKDAVKELIKKYDGRNETLVELLRARQIIGNTSIAKYKNMLMRVCDDDYIRDILFYHGAHTGRWTAMGVQYQNLVRPLIKEHEIYEAIALLKAEQYGLLNIIDPDIPKILKSLIRAAIEAPPGKKFVCSDFSGIETCIVMWLANHKYGLGLLRSGKSLYKDMAARIFGCHYRDIDKERTPNKYMLGKISILALVYGMGEQEDYPTFSNTCKKWGAKISHYMAKKIVYDIFRVEYSEIKEFWENASYCFKAAINGHDETYHISPYARLHFYSEDGFVFIQLPSGRRLAYYDCRLDSRGGISYMGVHPTTKQWVRLTTHGGKLTENIDSGIAADCLRNGMLIAENHGYEIRLTVHDELMCMVDENFGSVKELNKLICLKQKWMHGLPLTSEGWEGPRYRK